MVQIAAVVNRSGSGCVGQGRKIFAMEDAPAVIGTARCAGRLGVDE
jgi:hypothetical protein